MGSLLAILPLGNNIGQDVHACMHAHTHKPLSQTLLMKVQQRLAQISISRGRQSQVVLVMNSAVGCHYCLPHLHTHNTQPFYGSSEICPGPSGWAGIRKVKLIWIYWSKR